MRCALKTLTNKHTFSTMMHETRKDFYVTILEQFTQNGNDLLNVLDAIETGAIQCFVEED